MKEKNLSGVPHELLYTICLMVLVLCRKYLSAFAAFKAKYTEEYIANSIKEVNDAQALPDARQRNYDAKQLRLQLEKATKKVLSDWRMLKRYIKDAYPASEVAMNLQAAGQSFYEKASAANWSAVRSLIDAANTYMRQNKDQLMKNNNMPDAFPDQFKKDGIACTDASKAYIDGELQKPIGTKDKDTANQAIYNNIISLLLDGQTIYQDQPQLRSQFYFSNLLATVRGNRIASLSGTMYSGPKKPLEGVKIYSTDGTYKTQTDKAGRYQFLKIAAGTYTFIIERPGYESTEHTIIIKPGTRRYFSFTLPPATEMRKVA